MTHAIDMPPRRPLIALALLMVAFCLSFAIEHPGLDSPTAIEVALRLVWCGLVVGAAHFLWR